MSETCRLCKEKIPIKCLHFSNEIAVRLGWCSWFCMKSDLGFKEAMRVLAEETDKEKTE